MEYFAGDYADLYNNNNGVQFTVDDLLDFSKEDDTTMTDAFFDTLPGNSGDSSTVTAVASTNSSISDARFITCRSSNDSHFPGNELCVPYDDLAELEWLSNFVEESFSTTAGVTVATDSSSSAVTAHPAPPQTTFPAEVAVPGKARSKRSRAAPCDWSSRLEVLDPKTAAVDKTAAKETPARRCLHCASEKTPQWRTGPMGPKTLCNACGVRYKSGRLVPEYRPASSPTFVSARHSNSHRKVLELRRQKDFQRPMIGGHGMFNGCDGFLIRTHHGCVDGQDLRHVM